MRITVDPNAQSTGFDYVDPGLYRLRVVNCEQRQTKQYPYLNWELELADPNLKGVKGGVPGHVFEITTLKAEGNAQFRLRQVCEGLGLDWGDFETEDTKGLEMHAYLKVEEYQGTMKNVIDKVVKVSKKVEG